MMYLTQIQIVSDTYKRRNDGFYANIFKTLEEAIKEVNSCLLGDLVDEEDISRDELEKIIENSNSIRNDLIENHCGTEYTEELYKIMYEVYEIDENLEKKLILTNQ